MAEVLQDETREPCPNPDCNASIIIKADTKEGDTVECEECGCEFEVISVDPIELIPLSSAGAG